MIKCGCFQTRGTLCDLMFGSPYTSLLLLIIIACTLDKNLLWRSKGLSELLTLTIWPYHMHKIRDIVCQLRANKKSTCVIFYLEYQTPFIRGKILGPQDNTIFFNGVLCHKFFLSSPNCDRNSVNTLKH